MPRNRNPLVNQKEVNYSLRKTFEFIESHQLYPNGQILFTTLYLKLNLNQSQFPGNTDMRVDSSNTVTGFIGSVSSTNLSIYVVTDCEGIFTNYTVEFSKIIEVVSGSILVYFNEYLRYMEALPPLCEADEKKAKDLVEKIHGSMAPLMAAPQVLVRLIFNGVKSRAIYPSEITLVRNLVVIGEYIIIPYSFIGGYSLYLSCPNTQGVEKEEASLENSKKAELKEPTAAPEANSLKLGGGLYV